MKRGDDEMEDQTVDVIDENSSIVTIKDKPSKLFFCYMYCYKILFVLVEAVLVTVTTQLFGVVL